MKHLERNALANSLTVILHASTRFAETSLNFQWTFGNLARQISQLDMIGFDEALVSLRI
jgi:hypothetical protein